MNFKFLKIQEFSRILKCQRILKIFAVMKYCKKMEIFLANLEIKLDRTERPHCIASITA